MQTAGVGIVSVSTGRELPASQANTPERNAPTKKHKSQSSGSVLNLALVGTGKISARYLKQAGPGKRARFVAMCAKHLDSAKARSLEYGIKSWFDDYEKMYDTVSPDGVVVATPNSMHAAPTIAALERRIPVLCEKPMATTWEDCLAMVAASQRTRTLFLNLPYDTTSGFLAALAHLNETTLGKFTGAEAQLLWGGAPWDNWYYQRSVSGGAIESLVYPVSRLINLLGPAKRVTGMANTLIPKRIVAEGKTVASDIDDNITLTVEWETGQQAILRTLWATSMVSNDSVIYGRQGTLWFSSEEVVVHSPARPVPGAEKKIWRGLTDCYPIPFAPLQDVSQEGLIDHFVDCIRGIRDPTCGAQQQLHVHEILFKGTEAAHTGQVRELETTFIPWHHVDPSFYDTRSQPV
jgi:predicted dehydrogenase